MLTLVVIARDEADRIADCLASVPFAAEKIVLDSGSTDATVAVAEESGARVIRTDWPGHVIQKNRALTYATGDWILSLDADERLSPEAQGELAAALASPGDAAGFSFPRCSHWLGRPIRHGRWYPDRKLRVVRQGRGTWVGDDPHDRLETDGPVRKLQGDILHFPYRNLSEHLRTIDRYSAISAASLRNRGVRARWWDLAVRPPAHFVDAWLLRRGFLDGAPGLAIAGLGATHAMLKWTRLYLEDA
jgi:glycosyltransferase involved in cell wall biosynthesis